MIRTDGRPTIAMRESDPIPGQLTICDELARLEDDFQGQPMTWSEIDEAEPVYGGF
jgi:hypothetical protein